MRELSDNEFDRIIKEKSESFDFNFEEEAWDLMEKKLRNQDRIVLIRRFSIAALVLLFLSFGLFQFYKDDQNSIASNGKNQEIKDSNHVKTSSDTSDNQLNKTELAKAQNENQDTQKPIEREHLNQINRTLEYGKHRQSNPYTLTKIQQKKGSIKLKDKSNSNYKEFSEELVPEHNYASKLPDSLALLAYLPLDEYAKTKIADPVVSNEPEFEPIKDIKITVAKPHIGFTLAFGPDYSSIKSLKGKDGNLNAGFLVNLNYKKFSLSTGAKYGLKRYNANGFDYALANPANAKWIQEIEASCNVLELPAQLSYLAYQKNKKQLAVSAGLSSYLMLSEKYEFYYTPESGRPTYNLEKENANKSWFGVLSLSTAYRFKPTHQRIIWGIEPYLKLPLGGVGEGKVKLKSSGIALTMTYDIIKRN